MPELVSYSDTWVTHGHRFIGGHLRATAQLPMNRPNDSSTA